MVVHVSFAPKMFAFVFQGLDVFDLSVFVQCTRAMLEAGFEYVCQKDNLIFLRKHKLRKYPRIFQEVPR